MAEIKLVNKEISIFTGTDMNGDGVSRRLFVTVTDLNEIPEELFAVKISQSKKPEKAGRVVFKHLLFKQPGDTQPWQDLAPNGVTLGTPVAEIKQTLVNFVAEKNLQLEFELAINLNGKFANITTPEGRFTLFDDAQFPETKGNPGYYLKRGTVADVTLTERPSNYGGVFYQVTLSTASTPDEIFVRGGRAQVWGQENAVAAPTSFEAPVAPTSFEAPTAPAAPTGVDTTNVW